MKNQALFSSKDKSKKLKCCLLQFSFGALRVISQFQLLMGAKLICFSLKNLLCWSFLAVSTSVLESHITVCVPIFISASKTCRKQLKNFQLFEVVAYEQ